MNETKVRIDYVHHALSAMYQWVLAAEQDDNLVEDAKKSALLPHQNLRNFRRDLEIDEDQMVRRRRETVTIAIPPRTIRRQRKYVTVWTTTATVLWMKG